MPKGLPTNYPNVTLAAAYVPAQDAPDEVYQRLNDWVEPSKALPENLRAPQARLVEDLRQAQTLRYDAVDAYVHQVVAGAAAIREGAQMASASVGQGFGDGMNVTEARAAAARAYVEKVKRTLAGGVAAELQDRATKIADAAVADLLASQRAIQTSRASKALPALEGGFGPEDEARIGLLRTQMQARTMEGDLGELETLYSALVDGGDMRKVTDFETAALPLLVEAVSGSPAKLAYAATQGNRRQVRSDAVERRAQTARRLLGRFEKERTAREPEEDLLAEDLLVRVLVPAFRMSMGLSAWDLPQAEWSRVMEGGRELQPYEVLPGWQARDLPMRPKNLGWSALQWVREHGTRVRLAAGDGGARPDLFSAKLPRRA